MLKLPQHVIRKLKKHAITIDTFDLNKQINGFLWKNHIAINRNKDIYTKRFTVCHELSHKLCGHCHGENKYNEREANERAFSLLVSDSDLLEEFENFEGDTHSLEKVFGVPAELIQKRLIFLLK